MAGVDSPEVQPLRLAFDRVAAMLPKLSTDVPLLMTYCPFPTAFDFALYPPIGDALASRSAAAIKKVIKPGNSILHAHGAAQWFDDFAANSVDDPPTVVLGGCTLTSCIRVSALHLHSRYSDNSASQPKLNICVDLNLCAARASNYVRRCHSCLTRYLTFYGRSSQPCTCRSEVDLISPVDKAVSDMRDAGVRVFESFDWSNLCVTET